MNAPTGQNLERYLRGLPQADPSPQLRQRVLQAVARRRARRRWSVPLALAASAALFALVGPGLVPRGKDPGPAKVSSGSFLDTEMRALDRRLQAAYLAPLDEAEREVLWQARSAAESRLASGAQAPRLVQL